MQFGIVSTLFMKDMDVSALFLYLMSGTVFSIRTLSQMKTRKNISVSWAVYLKIRHMYYFLIWQESCLLQSIQVVQNWICLQSIQWSVRKNSVTHLDLPRQKLTCFMRVFWKIQESLCFQEVGLKNGMTGITQKAENAYITQDPLWWRSQIIIWETIGRVQVHMMRFIIILKKMLQVWEMIWH